MNGMSEEPVLSARETRRVAFEGGSALIKAPTRHDRARLRREVRAAGARPVDLSVLRYALREAVVQVYEDAPQEADKRLAPLDFLVQAEEEYRGMVGPSPEREKLEARIAELQRQVAAVEIVIKEYSEDYRRLDAEFEYYRDVQRTEAVRLFVKELTVGDETWRAAGGALPDAAVDALTRRPDTAFLAVAAGCYEMLSPSGETEKN